jgi:inositol-hexakisphosphate/diphosphoinositol-pentakisphosphate 1-kinase
MPLSLEHVLLEERPITIGVCAMEKKARSQPMMEILSRLEAFMFGDAHEFEVVFFAEEVILHKPVEEWPRCDALIAFFSTGFPLKKAQHYASLYKP